LAGWDGRLSSRVDHMRYDEEDRENRSPEESRPPFRTVRPMPPSEQSASDQDHRAGDPYEITGAIERHAKSNSMPS
jgi:hypothetical protein